jgi:vanillate O-demethylase monooxygenase subunit
VLPRARLADWEAAVTGLPRERDYGRQEGGTFVSPALHVQHYTIGTGEAHPCEVRRVHGFTPESPTTTHVFLRVVRNFALDQMVVGDHLHAVLHEMARRDIAAVEAVQRSREDGLAPHRDVNVRADRAALRARRVAETMVADESGPSLLRPVLTAAARG